MSNKNGSPIKQSTTVTKKTALNGQHVDTTDRAASKQNIIEVFQERPIPEKRTSVTDNNNLNLTHNYNGNVTNNVPNMTVDARNGNDTSNRNSSDMSRDSLPSAGAVRSQHDSLNSCSDDLPSFTSSIDDLELRDLRKAKREMDMRLVDREDQVTIN